MVDRVLSLDPGRSIVASKTMPETEELFRDHFPGFPVIPGVLLTEMMAQAGGRCLFAGDPEREASVERSEQGIPMLQESWNRILEVGESVGIEREKIVSFLSKPVGPTRPPL